MANLQFAGVGWFIGEMLVGREGGRKGRKKADKC